MGDVDFYPNNGISPQPGCEREDPTSLSCSHRRAVVREHSMKNVESAQLNIKKN